MSEGRFPSYHHLPPAAPAPQRHHLATAATPSVPHPLTFHPPEISQRLTNWFTKQDKAAYRNTPYASMHSVGAMQMYKPQHTPIIDRWIDSRNNMPPPSRPGPPSPSPAHSANMSPNFSLSRSVELDLTKHKKESEQMSIDLSANTQKYDSSSLKRTKDQINGQLISSKTGNTEEVSISVIAPNPHKVNMSEARGSPNISDSISIQKIKSVCNEGYENNKNKPSDVINIPVKVEGSDTNNVEKMLENMFQTNESEKLSVIKKITPIKSPSPSMMRAESVEKILKSPSPIPRIEHDKSEDSIPPENSSKKVHDTHSQFLEVENKLEELFGGVITSTSSISSDQQIVTDIKPKPNISTKRPYTKNKKKNKKNKILPTLEKPKPVIEPVNKKYKGPLIRVNGGNIENPTSFVIINRNVPDDEDSLDGRNINRKTYSFFDKSGVYNGEEIPDVSNLESSGWQCVFCSRGPHVRDIGYDPTGDLFGPYYVSIPKVAKTIDNPKRKKSKHNITDSDTSETFLEVWTHENCLVWASGVYMVGTKIFGLEDSVRTAKNTICIYCGVNGASIGCSARHCKSSIHYSCAIHVGWLLDSENFRTICNIHRNSLSGNSCH